MEKLKEIEIVSLLDFFKRMYLIAYTCFKYPFYNGDIYIDFKSHEIHKIKI